jgi:UDP-N-acetylmuramoyl-tripeptide--D-alanyl-D-alanine ligase
MDMIFVLASSAFLIWIIRNIIYWVYLWQVKEYRFQRVYVHLIETVQGRQLFFSPLSLLKWLGIVFYIATIIQDSYLDWFHLYITGLYALQAFLVFKELLFNQLKRPEFTPKALSLILTSLLLVLAIFSVPILDKYFWLLFIDRIGVLIVAFFVFIHSFPTELYYDTQINAAQKKIERHKDLMIIGITGSYGKSSTKEFLFQLLSKKFSVIKTRGNHHTIEVIASVIAQRLKQKTQILIAEMGTYGRGEIAQMRHIIKPNIAILTGINDQHLSLFRTLDESIAEKYELIETLPKKGLALFNANDDRVVGLAKKTKIQKVLYGYDLPDQEEQGPNRAISATDIRVDRESVSFTVRMKKHSFMLKAPLLGSYNIANLLPAIYIADYFGMTQQEIRRAVASLIPLPNTMTRHTTDSGIVLIDDTFNSNPESIKAAIDYLKIYRKKRFLVFQPMIELGHNAKEHHIALGKNISDICEYLLVTNHNFLKEIEKGIQEKNGSCTVIVGSDKKLTRYLQSHARRGDVILFEGNEAKIVLDSIAKEK